jgi:hypothetical protein
LRWEWVYEPFDLGGWSPDFAIRAPGASSKRKVVLVEVKPIMEFDNDVACKIHSAVLIEDMTHYDLLEYEPLLLGLQPSERRLGWLCELGDWDEAPFGRWENSDRIGFCHSVQSFRDRISGYHDGGSYGSLDESAINALWGQACAAVQWHPIGISRKLLVSAP